MNLFSPRLAVLLAILWAASLVWTYRFAVGNTRNACEAAKIAPLQSAILRHHIAAAAGQGAERQAAVRATKTENIFNGLQTGVLTYVQTHSSTCRLDADGLRLWAAANAGADTESATDVSDAVPAAAAAGQPEGYGALGESHRRGQELSPVSRPASGAGGLAGENP